MAKPKGRKAPGVPSSGPGEQDVGIEEEETTVPPEPGEDARGDDAKLKENRKRLNVDEEHKTPEMEKRHRGTFP